MDKILIAPCVNFARNIWSGTKFRRLINNLQRELKQELSIDEGKAFKQQLEELDGLMKKRTGSRP